MYVVIVEHTTPPDVKACRLKTPTRPDKTTRDVDHTYSEIATVRFVRFVYFKLRAILHGK